MIVIRKIYKKIKMYIISFFLRFINDDKKFVELQYKMVTGKKINLNNPQSYTEKINWIKLNYYNPLYEKCCDKIEVRKYVKEKGLENILTKLYKIYNNVDEIEWEKLPERYVIKTTHSSGGVVVVKDKSNLNIPKAKKDLRKSIKKNLWKTGREWQYKNLKPRIMVEELIETQNDNLIDYKFHCFDGKVRYILISRGLINGGDYCMDFYDENLKWLPVSKKGHKNFGKIEKFSNFEKMKKIAEKLAEDFVHVRVDLYLEKDKIYFGELTFTTGSGYSIYEPSSFDYEIGKYLNIEKMK